MLRRLAGPAGVFVVSFAVYAAFLPTTVSFEDSAEFVAAAATLGIPHPSGYPLFVLLGRGFAALPLGTVPWRIALLSATAAAGAAALAFATVRRIVRVRFPTTAGVQAVMALVILAFAVSETWWSQAIMAEAYALHGLLIAATGYALIAWLDSAAASGMGEKWRIAASVLFGLALANHLFLTLPIAPVFLALLLYGLPRGRRWKGVASSALAVLAGLLPYALLPLRSGTGAFAMGDASTVRGFLDHVLRLRYGDVGTPAWNKGALVLSYLQTILADLGPLLIVLGVAGAIALVRSRVRMERSAAAWYLGSFLVVPAVIAVRGVSWGTMAEYLYRVYAVPGLLATAVFAAVGAALAYRRWGASGRRTSGLIIIVALAAVPVFTAAAAAPRVAAFSDPSVETAMRSYLASLPSDAVLVMNDYGLAGDTELFVFAYLQVVAGLRPDVTVVTDTAIRSFHTPPLPGGYARFPLDVRRRLLLRAAIADPALADRPLLTSWPATGMQPEWRSYATGYAYVLNEMPQGTYAPPAVQIASGVQPALRAFASRMYYARAAWVLERDGIKAATPLLVKAIELDPDPTSSDYLGFVRHRAVLLEAGELPEDRGARNP